MSEKGIKIMNLVGSMLSRETSKGPTVGGTTGKKSKTQKQNEKTHQSGYKADQSKMTEKGTKNKPQGNKPHPVQYSPKHVK